ncbi:MAG: thioredoxin family protein [Halobacteriovorax sp.]|nr:thioredoxin family protein [Halobacteriovorax sp.]|tara:strand:- start:7467 stop:8054 length:588 start_codon:yes stop_codon:yes gene_type:complete
MKILSLISLIILSFSAQAFENGTEVPYFKLKGYPKDTNLSEHKGKYVVLEWYNDGCPFVRKHYDSKSMQKLQKHFKSKVVWLTINSSAPGKQGHLADLKAAEAMYKKEGMDSYSLLLDKGGKIGKMFEAKTTPHMYIIDPKGKLVYQGAIDSISSADIKDLKTADNYVYDALDAALDGKKIKVAKTRAYGCSVKY